MKNFKKIGALIVAIMLVLAMAVPAFATEATPAPTGTITITLPTQEVAPSQPTTYTLYKIFEATNDGTSASIAYQLVSGKTAPLTATDNLSKFDVDSAGNVQFYTRASTEAEWAVNTTTTQLSEEMIDAIAAYVDGDTPIRTVTVPVGQASVGVTGLPFGYYYITTTTGSVVTIDSTNPNASVQDKNTLPKVVKSPGTEYDKASLKAIAAVGTSQPYTAVISAYVGTINLVFTDNMTNQTYNGDVKVKVNGTEVDPSATTFTISGAAGASSFTVTFDNDYIASLTAAAVSTENTSGKVDITLNYSATITSDALNDNPATNKASISSGNGNGSDSEEIKTYNAKFTVTKKDGNGAPLAGAGFVISTEIPDTSEGAAEGATKTGYYKLNTTDPKSITWYVLADNETLAQAIADGKIDQHLSDANGAVPPFTGLGNGTYTLVESTTPSGYNTAADSTFTVNAKDYTATELQLTADVTNNSGTELPATGGMGTRIFYIVGAILALGAGIVLVTRRRAGDR